MLSLQLSGVSSLCGSRVINEVESTQTSLQHIQQQLVSALEQIAVGGEWELEISPVLSGLVSQVRELDEMCSYLFWLRHIYTLRYHQAFSV